MHNAIRVHCAALQVSELSEKDGWLYGLTKSTIDEREELRTLLSLLDVIALETPARELRQDMFGELVRDRRYRLRNLVPAAKGRRLYGARHMLHSQLKQWRELSSIAMLPLNAVFDFAGLPHESDATRDFLLRYGVFREQDLTPSDMPRSIGKFIATEWGRRLPFALSLNAFFQEQSAFRFLLDLHRAVREERVRDVERLVGLRWAEPVLEQELNVGLQNVRLRVSFDGPHARPSLSTMWVRDGLYAHLWNTFLEKCPVGICPRCSQPFQVSRRTKRFCSRRCEQAAKQQRYRTRLARRSA